MIFNRKKLHDPIVLVKLMCNWISDWSILKIKDAKAKNIDVGSKTSRAGGK